MKSGQDDPQKAAPGEQITTACGGLSAFKVDTPWAIYQGRVVYFCLPACKTDFERDPAVSCLAANPESAQDG